MHEVPVQKHPGEQPRRHERMASHRVSNQEPQPYDESSEETTNHAVDDDCLGGPFHLPDLAIRRSEEHTSELQSLRHLVCRLLLEKKKRDQTVYEDALARAYTTHSRCTLHSGHVN